VNRSADDKDYIAASSRFFERFGGWSYDHRWIVFAVCLALVAASAFLASQVHFDNSFESYFDRNDPAYSTYLKFRDDFGSDEVSYILYEAPDHAYGVWNLEVMRAIRQLTRTLEDEVPFAKEVTSLTNVEFLEPMTGGLKIYELLGELPESQEALLEVKRKAMAKPMYVGGLVSADGNHAAIMIEMEKSSIDPLDQIRLDPQGGDVLDNLYPQASYNKIEEILARPQYAGIRFHHTGDVPLNSVLNKIAAAEGPILGSVCFAVIAAQLLFFFRRPAEIVGPLAVVAVSVLVTVGFVALLGWSLDLMFSMLPTLLIAVGVADSVHVISEFRAYRARLGDRRQALGRTLYLVGTPCLLTSLTTAAGFASMSVAPIKTISHFAIYSAAGVLVAFVLTLSLLAALLSFGGNTSDQQAVERETLHAREGRFLGRWLVAVARFDIRNRRSILTLTAAMFAVSMLGMARLTVDSNFLSDFSEDVRARRDTIFADRVMGGTNSFVYLFDTGIADGIKEPAVLREIERLQGEADMQTNIVKKTLSIVDLLKDINQSFHDGDPEYYRLPETRELAAQYLLLYEMSGGEELEEYVSSDYSRATLELRCRWTQSSVIAQMAQNLASYLETKPLRASTVSETGVGALWIELVEYITQSQIRGFLLAFVAIAAMMCLLFQSARLGLLSMVPNLSPVILTLGGMGWVGVPLDYMRLLIAPVAIGIAVDNTIHLVTRYRHEFLARGDYEQALHASMKGVGRALFITSGVLVMGFLVFLFSEMDSQVTFGVLLTTTIIVALVANFFLMPALVLTFKPFGPAFTPPGAARRA
jgi:predicted RND superfamily exporter protein